MGFSGRIVSDIGGYAGDGLKGIVSIVVDEEMSFPSMGLCKCIKVGCGFA